MVFDLLLNAMQDNPSSVFSGVEEQVYRVVAWVKLVAECVSVLVVLTGVLFTTWKLITNLRELSEFQFNLARLRLARFLVIALEFQLAADILATAIAPTWDQIAKLAAISVIRTVLNYVLGKEIKEERELVASDSASDLEPLDKKRSS